MKNVFLLNCSIVRILLLIPPLPYCFCLLSARNKILSAAPSGASGLRPPAEKLRFSSLTLPHLSSSTNSSFFCPRERSFALLRSQWLPRFWVCPSALGWLLPVCPVVCCVLPLLFFSLRVLSIWRSVHIALRAQFSAILQLLRFAPEPVAVVSLNFRLFRR